MIELNEKALEAAARMMIRSYGTVAEAKDLCLDLVAAYLDSLAEQGIRLVDVREVAEAMREAKRGAGICGDEGAWLDAAKFIEAHFK